MNEHKHTGSQFIMVPTLSVSQGAKAIEFYKKAFGAIELMGDINPDGEAVAELSINGARFVVADESPEHANPSPERIGGTPVRIGLQVDDPDSVAKRAIEAGAKEIYPVADQDYGYRLGRILDPFGHHWEIFKPLY